MYERKIKLTQGWEAIVDDEDYENLIQYRWCAYVKAPTRIYAARKHDNRNIYMHHVIIEQLIDFDIDHINGNTLDNRRCNLRAVSRRHNILNSERCRNARVIEPHGNRFRVRPSVDGVRHNLGSFKTEQEAFEALERFRNA